MKKGFTLVELVIVLCIISILLILGVQFYSVISHNDSSNQIIIEDQRSPNDKGENKPI